MLEESVKSVVRRCAIRRMVSALTISIMLLIAGLIPGALIVLIGAYLLIGYSMELVSFFASRAIVLCMGGI